MDIKSYINKKYKPTENDLVASYYISCDTSLEEAANNIAKESSIGTWTEISTMNEKVAKRLRPSVYFIDKKRGIIKIAYPHELFEKGNMPQIWSSIAGNIFGMKAINKLRLLDIGFPKPLIKSFKGPRYGIDGIRKLTKTKERPLVGTIVKPKVGLSPAQHAKVAYEAWVGGLDVVKDDENLSSMSFNNFKKRMELTFRMRDRAEKETGEKKIYMPNITAETFEMLKRADIVDKCGGEYVMVDILTCGWSGVQTIRNKVNKVIHAHRAMHAALTRNPEHGISMLAIAKTARLIGVDQLHVGTASVGKMNEQGKECVELVKAIENKSVKENKEILSQEWHNIKPVLAVASGGLHPASTQRVMKKMGKNIVIQYGGGCHGHPEGTRAGATAIRQALDLAMKGRSLKTTNEKELLSAIDKFGI
ncbi:MAG: type III ribulose-bisphosphate carboxylase [Nanoarchaeota archaeon]